MIAKFAGLVRVSVDTLCLLVDMVIRASFSYGIPIWAPPDFIRSCEEIDKMQIQLVSRALRLPWNIGFCAVSIEACIVPMSLWWKYLALCFGRRVHTIDASVVSKMILHKDSMHRIF